MSMRTPDREQPVSRANPAAIVLSVVIGLVLFGVSVSSGDVIVGIGFLAVTWGFAALLHFGPRFSDTIALVGDDVQDERHVHIHQRAALYSLNLLGFMLIGAFIVNIARGGDGSPYSYMALIGAVTYFTILIALSRRS
jgi:hypothetical protein